VRHNAVEDRIPYLNSFDVLIQYLTTLAVSDGFYPDEIYQEIKQTFCYQALSEGQWQWLLNFLVMGSQSLKSYDEYKKVEVEDDGRFMVNSRAVAMRHRFQIGTIVGDATISVRYQKGGYIGSIEEYFISKLSPGDVFTFAGRNLEFIRIKGMSAYVANSTKRTNKVPSWMGGRLSFSAKMSELLRQELYTAELPQEEQSPEIQSLTPMFAKQREESLVPQPHQFLIETFRTSDGYHHIFYPFEGRAIHEGMSSLLAYRISLLTPITCSLAFNDYGFELLSDKKIDIQAILDNNLFTTDYMLSDLQKSLNSNEMARRKFRDIAVISGMVFTGYPEKGVKMKHLQSSSELLFDVFKDFEDDNLLYQQAYTETFEHQLEEGRLRLALERIAQQEIVWKQCKNPTPFSFPIITDRLREKLSNEKLADRIKRMTAKLNR
ncbi:MAG: DNA ligase-associated DEXH box helicase, partial [Bacteroidota bacterium]|nr:DNA ligase-associated DEXH box helicase [Bacteroidota bacterium]